MSFPFPHVHCSAVFDAKGVNMIKENVKTFMLERNKDAAYYSFLEWNQSNNELLILTMHAREGLSLPKSYDVIFEVNNPENHCLMNIDIKQAVWNGLVPIDQIELGHNHVCLIEYSGVVPQIFKQVSTFDGTWQQVRIEVGFCSLKDFRNFQSGNLNC